MILSILTASTGDDQDSTVNPFKRANAASVLRLKEAAGTLPSSEGARGIAFELRLTQPGVAVGEIHG